MNPSAKMFRLPFHLGAVLYSPDPGDALIPGDLMFATDLKLDHFDREGRLLQHRNLGSGVVTTAGVTYLAADFLTASANRINAFTYHGVGIGAVAAVIGDTALGNVTGVPARVSGTGTNSSANVYQSVATVSFVSGLAITEWGLFSASTSGTMWDRRVFSAINVISGDSIQFTYQLTCTAGG